MKLFKYLGKYWYAILAALILLVIQAHSDLTLPSITSDIVDVGIQQGGIENSTPDEIRKSTLSALELFMTDSEKETIEKNYHADTRKVDGKEVDTYVLDMQDGMTKDKLDKIFDLPMMMLASSQAKDSKKANPSKDLLNEYQEMQTDGEKAKKLGEEATDLGNQAKEAGTAAATAAASGDTETAQTKSAEATKLADEAKEKGSEAQSIADDISKEQDAMPDKLTDARKEVKDSLGDLGEDSMKTVAIQLTSAEYKALDKDTKQIQMDYMIKQGTKMVVLTLISAVAAILVGLIASLVSSDVGKNLRTGQFKQILRFSNPEMEKFSPASLITRSTNDIQQIQMGLVMTIRMVLYAPILGLGGIYQVYKTGANMEWIIAVAVGLVLLLVLILLGLTMPKFKSLQKLIDRVNLVSREIITGLPVIRAFSRERY